MKGSNYSLISNVNRMHPRAFAFLSHGLYTVFSHICFLCLYIDTAYAARLRSVSEWAKPINEVVACSVLLCLGGAFLIDYAYLTDGKK